MGKRKRNTAKAYREARAQRAEATLHGCPFPAQKVRLVADMVRGLDVKKAQAILRFTQRNSAPYIEKLLLSSMANWQQKNMDKSFDDAELYLKTITVGEGRQIKRIHPRAQGRAFRILKRSCHVYIELGDRKMEQPAEPVQTEATVVTEG